MVLNSGPHRGRPLGDALDDPANFNERFLIISVFGLKHVTNMLERRLGTALLFKLRGRALKHELRVLASH